MATDFHHINDPRLAEELEESLDDLHQDTVQFVADDSGSWWARMRIDRGDHARILWFHIVGDIVDDLAGVIEQQRTEATSCRS